MQKGSIVMFTDVFRHSIDPDYYPEVRTIGYVIGIHSRYNTVRIQWPSGSTSGKDQWWCSPATLVELSHDTKTKG